MTSCKIGKRKKQNVDFNFCLNFVLSKRLKDYAFANAFILRMMIFSIHTLMTTFLDRDLSLSLILSSKFKSQ